MTVIPDYLFEKLDERNHEIYLKFTVANKPTYTEEFTFFFPEKVAFYYQDIDPVLIQLQIFLHKIRHPFDSQMSVTHFYGQLKRRPIPIQVVFDLNRTHFVGDGEMLMLRILGLFCSRITKRRVLLKINESLVSKLIEWNFFEDFDEWAKRGVELEGRKLFAPPRSPERLIPIKKIASLNHSNQSTQQMLEDRIAHLLRKQYGMDDALVHSFATNVISELCQNIPIHSHSIGFLTVHARNSSPFQPDNIPNIEISLADAGIGLRQSLWNRYPDHYRRKPHHEVITEVLEGRFLQKEGENHGGILRARRFTDGFNGAIFIRSICAKCSNRPARADFDRDTNWRFFPGTQISILIPRMSLFLNKK